MNTTTWWWVAAGIVLAVELTVGTIYLLMVAAGLALAAIAGHLGFSSVAQLSIFSVLTITGTIGLYLLKRRQQSAVNVDASHDPNVILDVGETITITQWHSDGTSRVQYRGTQWTARLQDPEASQLVSVSGSALYRIVGIQGNQLLVQPISH